MGPGPLPRSNRYHPLPGSQSVRGPRPPAPLCPVPHLPQPGQARGREGSAKLGGHPRLHHFPPSAAKLVPPSPWGLGFCSGVMTFLVS